MSAKTATKSAPKADKRNGVPPSLAALLVAIEREYNAAVTRCKSTLAVAQPHTLWETADR